MDFVNFNQGADWYEAEYKFHLNLHGIECPCCEGRGSFGKSVGGVTLSWRECSNCAGYGLVLGE